MTVQGFTAAELDTLARFEAAPEAPEAFDPIAALRRVEALAESYEAAAKEQSRLAEKWAGNTLGDHFAESAENAGAVAADLRAALAGPDQGDVR